MIYPSYFPTDNENIAERNTYFSLKTLPKADFDVFFGRKFTSITKGERTEYEADFIIADIRNNRLNGILIIEVKGGRITFDGQNSTWSQNGKHLTPSPTTQASSIMHSLISRFHFLAQSVPFGWVVWFPDEINPGQSLLPTELHEAQFFDRTSLNYSSDYIISAFNFIYEEWPNRTGERIDIYIRNFKEPLIRSLGFALPLHKKIEAAEIRFIELTKRQLELLKVISINPNIIVSGPAGSGKTVMATTIAREYAERGQKVLLLTYNRVLANNIRYGLGNVNNPEVANYHSLAKRYIDAVDEHWWQETTKDDEFWSLAVPIKLMGVLEKQESGYDVIIVDEAQDLRSEWFETLELMIKPEGGFFIFTDSDQDIFDVKSEINLKRSLFKFELTENCRNTVKIIEQLRQYVNRRIDHKADAIEGEPVRIIEYKSDTDQMNKIKTEWLRLVEEEHIAPDKILIMMNADKRRSCLGNTAKFGKYKIESLNGRTGQLDKTKANYTSINTFKGLEADVVLIIDTDKVVKPDLRVLYAQASRAKYLLVIYKQSKNS